MIGVIVGLVASRGRRVVPAVIVVALPQKVGRCLNGRLDGGTYLAVGTGAGHIVPFSAGS